RAEEQVVAHQRRWGENMSFRIKAPLLGAILCLKRQHRVGRLLLSAVRAIDAAGDEHPPGRNGRRRHEALVALAAGLPEELAHRKIEGVEGAIPAERIHTAVDSAEFVREPALGLEAP